jgi:hypothetical protein
MDDINFEDFSQMSTNVSAESSLPRPPPPPSSSKPSAPPRVSAKLVSQFYKNQQKRQNEVQQDKSRDRVMTKLAKVEQYIHHFKDRLKGKYKQLKPESCSEEEVDYQLKLIEKELCSENAPQMMETAYLMFVKGFQMGNRMLGNPVKLMLDAPYSVSDMAADDKWMSKVRSNLMHLQIKYGMFETGPEMQFMINFASLLLSVDEINRVRANLDKSSHDFNASVPEERREKYNNL